MLRFDEKQIIVQIEPLPKRLRVAFAAACAQRQLPICIRTSAINPAGNPEAVTRILRELWDSAERDAFNPEKLRRDLAVCDALIPGRDAEYFSGSEFVQSALISLHFAVDTGLSGGSREAMRPAWYAYEALDEYIIQRFAVDVNAPGHQLFIDANPIIQAELLRQKSDLAELGAVAKDLRDQAAVISRIRRRAEKDASSFFG